MSSRHRSRSPSRRSSRHSRRHRDEDNDARDYERERSRDRDSPRDRKRERERDHRRERDRSQDRDRERYREDDDEPKSLPHDAPHLSESDYFLRNTEFRKWLKDEKDRYFDELSGEKARSYFAKFVKAWNRGKLSKSYYSGAVTSTRQHASDQTSYKWSFASKSSSADDAAIGAARRAVETATRGGEADDYDGPTPAPSTSTKDTKRPIGPALPTTTSDLTLLRESQHSHALTQRTLTRKRERQEDKERIEDLVGPKAVGREGMLEKKRARRESDRAFREGRDDGGFGEVDEGTLMGGTDSFQARIAQRDAARKRFEEKRAAAREDRDGDVKGRQDAMRQKEKETMDMFRQMAKERFG